VPASDLPMTSVCDSWEHWRAGTAARFGAAA
jgi:hypothetical protein